MVDDYVPVGARAFRLESAEGLRPGDPVFITRPSTGEWIRQLGAAEFGGGVGGGWKPGTRDITWDRVIQRIDGETVTVDAPITTACDRETGAGTLRRYQWPGRITNVGVENIRLESSFHAGNPKDENHAWCAISVERARDVWVRQVVFEHFAGSAVALFETTSRATVRDCLSLDPISEPGGYRRHTFFSMGQQTLFLRCYSEKGRHDFSVGHCAAGPNAFVQCEAHEALADSGPIESWASGVLYDNVVIDGNALALGYRPGNNAAIGWAAANSVLWNCSASIIRCWNPPGAQNWSFGSWASFEGDGVWRGSNTFMEPDFLLAAQLRDRAGEPAVARLQLMPRPVGASSNPTLDLAQELAAASHHPPPLLRHDIANVGRRAPIPSDPGNAATVDSLGRGGDRGSEALPGKRIGRGSSSAAAPKRLMITNGWLTCAGELMIGGIARVTWWRGNIRPPEAASFGLGLTRFVPGRTGPGLTDDLSEVADTLVAGGRAALDYHYGLWYDRRRDDHERVRRVNGDVIPPFYEQPFARSGRGTAWDGLSQYDLRKFNPWYWARLRDFANICEQRGLILFHQHYFQHNILEAGAHWTDCPWRSANNVNQTDFPEPPPYAGDKRIYMAELFYDVTHPVRRDLHRHYIRQGLEALSHQPNVIQFASAEFTGPLPFMEFWLDVVSEWQRETGHDLLTALSATKDVQDPVLTDPQRRAVVDVLDFRYWWRTDHGEFAPPGGMNLAPRQFERRWRGGRPNDVHLAGMAAEYRAKFPGLPVICDFEAARWAWVCAGGSLPRLPKTTDRGLLKAIPRMQPWVEAAGTGGWVIREPGKQMLAYLPNDARLDLSGESGSFQVQQVDSQTGGLTPMPSVAAGDRLGWPTPTVVWLVKED
jgi:hypothetical protein